MRTIRVALISIAFLLSSIPAWAACDLQSGNGCLIGNIKRFSTTEVITKDVEKIREQKPDGEGFNVYAHPFGEKIVTTTSLPSRPPITTPQRYPANLFEDCRTCDGNQDAAYQLQIYSKHQDPRMGQKFDKPILVTQGFDAKYKIIGQQFNFDEFQSMLNTVYDQNFSDIKVGFDNGQDKETPERGLLRVLYDEGYDIALLLWKNPLIDIPTNAKVTLQALRWLQDHTDPREGTEAVVIGPSMGGLVTRYALQLAGADPANDIRARLFIAFDSPNRGAEIPMSLQAFVSYFREHNTDAGRLFTNLTSPAARQLLLSSVIDEEAENPFPEDVVETFQEITDYENPNDPGNRTAREHAEFMRKINDPNFRAQLQKIVHRFNETEDKIYTAAFINGSGAGIDIGYPQGVTYALRSMESDLVLALQIAFPGQQRLDKLVFFGDINPFGIPFQPDKLDYTYFLREPAFVENAPGGLRDTYRFVIRLIDEKYPFDHIDPRFNDQCSSNLNSPCQEGNHSFIPSISGAALSEEVVNINDPESWYRQIGTHCDLARIMLCPFGTGIFDEFRAPVRNQRHVAVTSENKNWLLELIRNRGPQNAPGVVTPSVDRVFCALDPDGGNLSWIAEFGYFNSGPVEVTIPVGPVNRFTGPLIEQNEGQPVTFLSGRHQRAFALEFGGVTNRGFPAWTLAGTTVVPTILRVPQRCAVRALPQQ